LESGDHCGAASWDDGALVNAGLGEVEGGEGGDLAEAVREGGREACGVQYEILQRREHEEG
jgi:hypothetical protein